MPRAHGIPRVVVSLTADYSVSLNSPGWFVDPEDRPMLVAQGEVVRLFAEKPRANR